MSEWAPVLGFSSHASIVLLEHTIFTICTICTLQLDHSAVLVFGFEVCNGVIGYYPLYDLM